MARSALIDLDGTLVDTNYQHALAWFRAFRTRDLTFPLWEIHRHIGMGGDQMVGSMGGEELEREAGQELRDEWKRQFEPMMDEVQALEGATELLRDLREAGWAVVLASSAEESQAERYIDLLSARELIDDYTTSADVESTKPEPDLVLAALEKAGGGEAVMIGDSVYDCEAAARVGIPTVALLTGGFSEQELRDAGAVAVYRTMDELRTAIPQLPVAAPAPAR